MYRRLLVLLTGLLALPAWAAEGPRQNLWVELRWVESSVSGAAVAGVREGAVVVGTAGSVSPRGAVELSTRRRDEGEEQAQQRLLVLNGHSASVQHGELAPVEWLDYGVQADLNAGQAQPGKVYAVPRMSVVERETRGFTVSPHWPGGSQPVRVELKAQDLAPAGPGAHAGAAARQQVLSTVQVPLGDWVTVARSGQDLQRQQRGVLSSRDAEARGQRELQLRVQLAP
ncbi:hypothetical protein [Paucibacter soli]|uniref:hypothetical protein n=1 Tax=Paucibacter soli TaxID=3133433 RepID=UPI0030B2371B